MAVLHIVPLPSTPGGQTGPAFAMIFEVVPGENDPGQFEPELHEAEIEQLQAFARNAGAVAMLATNRSIVVLDPRAVPIEPGPCPSYMDGLGRAHLCDLRAGHDGLHEETTPGDGANPPSRATWGERRRWENSLGDGMASVIMADPTIDLGAYLPRKGEEL